MERKPLDRKTADRMAREFERLRGVGQPFRISAQPWLKPDGEIADAISVEINHNTCLLPSRYDILDHEMDADNAGNPYLQKPVTEHSIQQTTPSQEIEGFENGFRVTWRNGAEIIRFDPRV